MRDCECGSGENGVGAGEGVAPTRGVHKCRLKTLEQILRHSPHGEVRHPWPNSYDQHEKYV